MNERIGQLAEQAGLLGPSSRVGNSHQATEKFAELLILECASQVRFTDLLLCNDDSDEEILLQASVQLKRHFGVEL